MTNALAMRIVKTVGKYEKQCPEKTKRSGVDARIHRIPS